MIKIFIRCLLLLLIFFPLFRIFPTTILADDLSDKLKKIREQQVDLENKIANSKYQQKTLFLQIQTMDNQISLTALKIEETKNKLADLENKITQIKTKILDIETSLEKLSDIFIGRINTSYKSRIEPFTLFFSSKDFNSLLTRLKYLRAAQIHDKEILVQMENTKTGFKEQKKLLEDVKLQAALLKNQLEDQKIKLSNQKRDKEKLLEITRNDEKRYQELLGEAQREAEQIQKALATLTQTATKHEVKKGDVIGLMGNTGFSSGPHLHFGSYNISETDLSTFNFNQKHENPFSSLKKLEVFFEGSSCDDITEREGKKKTISTGPLDWPMNGPTISQCYGHTPWSWKYSDNFHNGIDMYNNLDIAIHSADDGIAYVYRGGQSEGNGVFVFHKNNKMTLYWHLQ